MGSCISTPKWFFDLITFSNALALDPMPVELGNYEMLNITANRIFSNYESGDELIYENAKNRINSDDEYFEV